MIKPPSLLKPYTLIYSGDPALDLPALAADNASDDEKKAAIDRRNLALKNARETGGWQIKPDETPTLFHFEPLNARARDRIEAEIAVDASKRLGPTDFASLVFRLAVRRIDNIGDVTIAFSDAGGYQVASEDLVAYIRDTFGIVGDRVIGELSQLVMQRTFSISPL